VPLVPQATAEPAKEPAAPARPGPGEDRADRDPGHAAPAPPPPPAVEDTRTITRAEFDREINDFDKLMASVVVEPADGGGFTIVELEPKSWIHHLGFRKGDVVRKIAGESISTIEDAARVYGKLRGVSSVTSEIERGTGRVNLRIDIK
jgi:S1-C subfamily serine protease